MRESSKFTIELKGLHNIASYIYRMVGEYEKAYGSRPAGIILPARIFFAMSEATKMHGQLDINTGVMKYLFGFWVTPSTANEISLIPNDRDVLRLAAEGLKNEAEK